MKKLALIISLLPILCSAQSVELKRWARIDQSVLKESYQAITIDTKTNELSVSGISDPNAGSPDCAFEGFTHIYNSEEKVHKYLFTEKDPEGESCAVLVDTMINPKTNKLVGRVQMNDGYACQSFCSLGVAAKDLEGYYR